MTTWTSDELNKIGTAEELELAPLRRDGTLRTPVTIWVVRLGDDTSTSAPTGGTAAPGSAPPRCATKVGSGAGGVETPLSLWHKPSTSPRSPGLVRATRRPARL